MNVNMKQNLTPFEVLFPHAQPLKTRAGATRRLVEAVTPCEHKNGVDTLYCGVAEFKGGYLPIVILRETEEFLAGMLASAGVAVTTRKTLTDRLTDNMLWTLYETGSLS